MVGTTVELVRVPTMVLPSETYVNVVVISWVTEVSIWVREGDEEDASGSSDELDSSCSSELVGVKVDVDVTVEMLGGGVTVEVVGGREGDDDVRDVVELVVELLSFWRFIIAMASSRGSAATNAARTKTRIASG